MGKVLSDALGWIPLHVGVGFSDWIMFIIGTSIGAVGIYFVSGLRTPLPLGLLVVYYSSESCEPGRPCRVP